MNICDGEGCSRANCKEKCTRENEGSAACVVKCKQWDEDHGYHSFCFDCRIEECKKDWDESCEGCTKVLAPLLVKEVEELRGRA